MNAQPFQSLRSRRDVDAPPFRCAADNVVMVRTFSKIGLAALRLGWVYAPAHVVDVLNRLRGPFNVSVPAQRAGAEAMRDLAFTRRLNAYNATWRSWLTQALRTNRMRVIDSQANFVLVLFPEAPAGTARAAFDMLLGRGLIVREVVGREHAVEQ